MVSELQRRLWDFGEAAIRQIVRMNLGFKDWVLIGAGILVLGLYCLRGFGSRRNY